MTAAQWSQLEQVEQERSEGAETVAAIAPQIDTERRCRHCEADGEVRHDARVAPLKFQAVPQEVQCIERHGASQAAPAGVGALVGGAGLSAAVGAALRRGSHAGVSLAASLHATDGTVGGAAGRADGSGRKVCAALPRGGGRPRKAPPEGDPHLIDVAEWLGGAACVAGLGRRHGLGWIRGLASSRSSGARIITSRFPVP